MSFFKLKSRKNGSHCVEKNKVMLDRNVIYSFGSQSHQNYGQVIFKPNGELYGYSNQNEFSWKMDNNELCLLNNIGEVTSRFQYYNDYWLGHGEGNKWPFYLLPLIKFEFYDKNNTFNNSGFFVNSIPKSGTYFLEDALKKLGVDSTRLHLTGHDVVDDFRNLPDHEIHVNPGQVRIACPVHYVTQMLNGRIAVGHVEEYDSIIKMHQQKVTVFNLRRNLRDVLVSLYRFKFSKVKPFGEFDLHWRSFSEQSRFVGFLLTYSQFEISHIKQIGEMMLMDKDSIDLTYEEMCEGVFSDTNKLKLEQVRSGFSNDLSSALSLQYGKVNPTYSGSRSNWQSIWNDDAESFFQTSGLADLNSRLGY